MELTRDHKIAAVHSLQGKGLTVSEIAKRVGVSRRSVDRFKSEGYDQKIGKVAKFFDGNKFIEAEGKPLTAPKPSVYKMIAVNKTITIVKDGKPKVADRTHRNIEAIKKAVLKKNYEEAYNLIDARAGVKAFSGGLVEVFNGTVVFGGRQIEGDLGEKIVQMVSDNRTEAAETLSNFLKNVVENPDPTAADRLFKFVRAKDLIIDEDGYILAWKLVRSNYLDIYTGTMDNSPGQTVKMDRSQCNPNPDETCSRGLHVCSLSYLSSGFGGGYDGNRVVQVRVHPRDFVAIPRDYNDAKARTCEYVVLRDATDRAKELQAAEKNSKALT